ncbi:hypothetical protein AAF143_02015 [Cyanobium sp. ATX-6F1]
MVGHFSPEAQEETLEGKMWDISPLGACLVVPSRVGTGVGCRGELLVCDPHSPAQLILVVELRWIEPAPQATFMGLMFIGGRLPQKSFLTPYFKVSWVDAMQVRRLDDLR